MATFTFTGNGAYNGGAGSDTLLFNQTNADLSGSTVTGIEIFKAGVSTAATVFTVEPDDIGSLKTVQGNKLADKLIYTSENFDLSSITLTSVEILEAGNTTAATIFKIQQADLAKNGTVTGDGTLHATITTVGSTLDLSSTTTANIETLSTTYSKGTTGTTFTLDGADFTDELANVTGSSGADTLVVKSTTFDLSDINLTSVETLKAGVGGATNGTTFTLDEADLDANGGDVAKILGSSGTDKLVVIGEDFDLSATTLSSIEHLISNDTDGTVFKLDQADLAKNGFITATTATDDEIEAAGSSLDLTSTTLTEIEKVSGDGATITITANQLTALDSFEDTDDSGILIVKGSAFDVSAKTLAGIDTLKAGVATATTFTLTGAQIGGDGLVNNIVGSTGSDKLVVEGTAFDLSDVTLSSIEQLIAGDAGDTEFTLDQGDLAKNGSVIGSTGTDTIIAAGSILDLSSTSLSSIEKIHGVEDDTIITLTDAQFAVADIDGDGDDDVLVVKTTNFDLTGNTVDAIEEVRAGLATATTFTVNLSGINGGADQIHKITGSTGSDTLIVAGTTAFDLSSVALSSIEKLVAGTTFGTTFTLDADDVAGGGSIVGNGTNVTDTIVASGSSLDLSKTTLTGIDELTTKFASGTQGTVFTVTNAQLAGLAISGSTGIDTVKIATTSIDFTSTTLTSIEGVGAGSTSATTITLDDDQLKANGGDIANIEGNNGVDTLKINGTAFDLSDTTVSNIEKLVATNNGTDSTVFTLDNADLSANGSITGSTNADDEVIAAGTALDLSKTTLSGIEVLSAGSGDDTTFTLTAAQVKALKIDGTNGDDDTLVIAGSAFDVSSADLTSIEMLKAGLATATTFTVTEAQLGDIEAITGSSGSDTLIVKGTDFDLSGTAVTNVEALKAGSSLATTFTVDQADLVNGSQIVGSTGIDTLVGTGTGLNLSSTTLSSIELLQADKLIVDQADLAKVTGIDGNGSGEVTAAGSQLDLTSTTLTGVETLSTTFASGTNGTTFTVDQGDLASGGSVVGAGGTDTLIVKGASADLTATDLTSIEALKSGSTAATTFTLDADDLSVLTSITGSAGSAATDTLIVTDTDFDLTSTSLTSVEVLKAGADDTTFTLTQDDLANGGSVIGSTSGNDTIAAGAAALDLTSTTLSNIENITISDAGGATLTVTAAQLAALNVTGGASNKDTLIVAGTEFDLTSTTLTDFEALKTGSSLGTTFTLDFDDVKDLGANGSITGSSLANDTLTILGTEFDLSSTTLSSVEILKGGSSLATTFTLDGDDISAGGTIIGSSGSDTVLVNNTEIDLSSTTLSSIEKLQAGNAADTTFTLTQAQVNSGLAISGSTGDDTLIIAGTNFDLTSASVTSIENLKGGADGTTFTVDQADLVSGGSVTGNTGSSSLDTLIVKGTQADLSSTSIDSVETLKASSNSNTTFIVDDDDLAAQNGNGGGFETVVGGTGTDTLQAAGSTLDLSGTELSGIEIIAAGIAGGTDFTVDQADVTGRTVNGNNGSDAVISTEATGLDLSSTTLSSVEVIDISAGGNVTVDQADLANGSTVIGSGASNKLISNGTSLDLASTNLTSIEVLEAKSTLATTFTVNNADILAGGGSVTTITGSTSSGDTLAAADTALDVTGLTLTGIEKIVAGTDNDTTITVTQAAVNALGAGGSILGGAGLDTLATAQAGLDLSSTTVNNIEMLSGSNVGGTTFTVNQADLSFGGTVSGAGTTDILLAAGSSLNLQNITLVGIEQIGTAYSLGTTFTVDTADLAVAGMVSGHSSANDTLILKGTAFDLTSTVLSSIEILQATGTDAVTFTLDVADLATGGSVLGTGKNDILTIAGTTNFDLSHTTVSSVEHLLADTANATFKVDQADLASGGTIEADGVGGTDIVSAAGTSLDLTSTTLVEIEEIHSGTTLSTTFTVDAADLTVADTVVGSAVSGTHGVDTLVINGATFDLTSTTLTNIDVLQAGSTNATTFTVDQADLISGGSVVGHTGASDSLIVVASGTTVDLSNTTLTSIESIAADDQASATLFKIGGGQGGAQLELSDNDVADTIAFSAGYKVTDVSSEATIETSILTINEFEDGAGGDKLDLSAVTKGTGTYQDIQAVIDFLTPADLQEALDLAAHTAVGANAKVVQFEFDDGSGLATYVVVDNSAEDFLTTNDAVIKLVGSHNTTLTPGDNFAL